MACGLGVEVFAFQILAILATCPGLPWITAILAILYRFAFIRVKFAAEKVLLLLFFLWPVALVLKFLLFKFWQFWQPVPACRGFVAKKVLLLLVFLWPVAYDLWPWFFCPLSPIP